MRKSLLVLLFASACTVPGGGQSADRDQAAQTAELQEESNRQVGMPGVSNFTEKRLVRQLYELRDQADLATHTYVVDLEGRLWHVCDSIGYGIPFSAQFSNPEVKRGWNDAPYTIPQPEPNGLWPPTSTSATWVVCASPDGDFKPLYVEPTLIVSPFPLRAHGTWALPAGWVPPTTGPTGN